MFCHCQTQNVSQSTFDPRQITDIEFDLPTQTLGTVVKLPRMNCDLCGTLHKLMHRPHIPAPSIQIDSPCARDGPWTSPEASFQNPRGVAAVAGTSWVVADRRADADGHRV